MNQKKFIEVDEVDCRHALGNKLNHIFLNSFRFFIQDNDGRNDQNHSQNTTLFISREIFGMVQLKVRGGKWGGKREDHAKERRKREVF